MPPDYLHNHTQFPELIRIVAEQKGIDPALVEKDYWIMHCLYGLQKLGLTFATKRWLARSAPMRSRMTAVARMSVATSRTTRAH